MIVGRRDINVTGPDQFPRFRMRSRQPAATTEDGGEKKLALENNKAAEPATVAAGEAK